jgi:CRP/FNR family transcriptional regulator, cyclic AMP receptor protein
VGEEGFHPPPLSRPNSHFSGDLKMEQEIALLRETELFRDLTGEQIRKILSISRKVSFSENQVIMREGEEGDAMYIILEGTVEVVKSLVIGDPDEEADEKNKVFTRLDASVHAVFGEIGLFEAMKRTATIKTVTKCRLFEIRRGDLLRLADANHELGYRIFFNLAKIVSARLKKADEDTIKLTTALSIILRES